MPASCGLFYAWGGRDRTIRKRRSDLNMRYADAPGGRTICATKKGTDFTRMAIAMALRPGIGECERYAESRWGSKSRVARVTKATIAGLTTQTGAGSEMVSDEGAAAEFFQLVLAKSVVGRLPLRRVPFRTRMLMMLESPPVAWRERVGVIALHRSSWPR
jgi:hypothetical protein